MSDGWLWIALSVIVGALLLAIGRWIGYGQAIRDLPEINTYSVDDPRLDVAIAKARTDRRP